MVGDSFEKELTMARFFVPSDAIDGEYIHIIGEEAAHMTRVLRMRAGDTFTACDGAKTDYLCEIESADKKEVLAKICEKKENEAESDIRITLYQGIPKGAKLDYIVQKCVEIGACSIVPVKTERVVKGGDVKRERLSRIAFEAAKQSGRGIIPEVGEALSFADAASEAAAKTELVLFPYECEKDMSLKCALRGKTPCSVSVFIGPEGGFSKAEVSLAKEKGFAIVTLGKRILRTETAGAVTCGNIFYELEG